MLQIEYFHRSFDNEINNDQELKKISQVSSAGLCWSGRLQRLDYSDEKSGKNFFWTKDFGEVENIAAPGRTGALIRDFCGRLTGVLLDEHSLVRWHEGSAIRFAADHDGEKIFPSSVASHSCGILYFAGKPAVYYALPESLVVTKAFPLGGIEPLCMGFTRAETLFLLSDKSSGSLLMLDFEYNATLTRPRTFAFRQEFPLGAPTGIDTDKMGRVYCASPAGIHIFDYTGLRLARVGLPGVCRTVAIGGRKNKTLFAGTSEGIFAIALNM